MTTYFYDTETTSSDPTTAQVIEAASAELDTSMWALGVRYQQRFRPSDPITPGAMAVHHITRTDLEDCAQTESYLFEHACPDCTYLIGHNVSFDWEVSRKPDVKLIDTLVLARYLWPDIEHKLGALMYHFYGEDAKPMLVGAHNALVDVENLAALFLEHIRPALPVAAQHSIAALHAFSEEARIPRVMAFGKYKGEKIEDVPIGYMQWAFKQPDFDPYVLEAFRRALRGPRP